MVLQTEGGVCGQLRTLGAEEVVCVKIMPASQPVMQLPRGMIFTLNTNCRWVWWVPSDILVEYCRQIQVIKDGVYDLHICPLFNTFP